MRGSWNSSLGPSQTETRSPLPRATKLSGSSRMLFDWVSQIAKAPTAIMVTRVTMNGGIASCATARPLKRPTSAAIASIAAMATGVAHGLAARRPPCSVRSVPQIGAVESTAAGAVVAATIAAATLVRPMTAPWLRSMPAMVSTKVWPTATTSSGHMFDMQVGQVRRASRASAGTGRGRAK